MIKRIGEIIDYQFNKYEKDNKQIFFIPFEDEGESELIENNLIQGYEIDFNKNSLKKSYDLTDLSLTNTGDALNDLTNLLNVISKLSPKMLKSIFLYEKNFKEFNSNINSFKPLVLNYQNFLIPKMQKHNKFIADKILYFINNVILIKDENKKSEDIIQLSNYIRSIRETKLLFDDYYNTYLGDKYLLEELDKTNILFISIDDLAISTLRNTRFFN